MRRALASMLLLVAFLLSFAGSASAYVDYGSKNRVGSFGDPFAPQVGFADPLALELHQENTIAVYDPATGVLFYVRQNPWTMVDPHGLNEKKLYRPRFWSGANLWRKSNKNLRTSNFISKTELQPFSGQSVRRNHGVIGTQKHGFIDIGHVRHNMDRTLSFHIQLSKQLKNGNVPAGQEMQSHANRDSHPIAGIGVKPLEKVKTPFEVTAKNVHEASARMAEAEAKVYEDSTKGNPSYYSTEDLPSNLLGINIAKDVLEKRGAGYRPTTEDWSSSMDAGLNKKLNEYGSLSKKDSHQMYVDYGPSVWEKTKGKNKTNIPVIFTNYEKKK